MFAVKFDSLEKREAFREFCDYIGWSFGMLIGAENGWWVDNDSGSKDDEGEEWTVEDFSCVYQASDKKVWL